MAQSTWAQPALEWDAQEQAPSRSRYGPAPKPLVDGKKICTRCDEAKHPEEFSPRRVPSGRSAHHSWCRVCLNAYRAEKNRIGVRRRLGLPLDTPTMQGRRPVRPDGSMYFHRGYVMVKATGHHRADRYGWTPQHIVVAEAKYGFPITREFTVHHENNDKADNRPENLVLRVGNHGVHGDVIPTLLRRPELRAVARAVLAQYDD